MKKLLSLVALGACLSFGAAQAQTAAPGGATATPAAPVTAPAPSAVLPDRKPTTQQTKMATCNKDATGKKGDDRKAFMKTCLSAEKVSQQDKMKNCNATAKTKALKGDERKAYMKTCLSGA